MTDDLASITGFQWDEGNSEKNLVAHQVTRSEIEQVFLRRPIAADSFIQQSGRERRYYALGQTDAGRRLFVVFTTRNQLIRVISARDMSRRERRAYTNAEENEDS
ncbi:MAG: hypothetical protein BZY81_08550 [SAR202 cluster bacterium Io17-Chloro-G4]|nr:MAG: hypothetical protein BZY81_08550 [SAR202 cluster bacterium Io17-Chloro-G4]